MTTTSPATAALPRTAPSEVGVDAAGVAAFVDAVEAAPDLELHSLMLLRHGKVLAEAWWAPYQRDDAPLLYSLSKSFTSTAFGFAVAKGRLGLDDRLVDHLPPTGPVGERTGRIRLRHLAAMATGHHEDALDPAFRADPEDPARGLLTLEPESEPGSVFAYNNIATYALGTVVQQVTGQTLTDYLTPRLFEPLGITPGSWDQHPAGRDVGFTGFHLATEAIARFGQLYLDGGRWDGKAVLPDGWAELATSLHTPNPAEPNPDWRQGYGFQFWHGRHGSVRGDGAFGQFCVLLREQDMVLVTTAGTENLQGILDAAWTHLLPAVDRPGSAEADAALRSRLEGLEVATDAAGLPPGQTTDGIVVTGLEASDEGWRLGLREGETVFADVLVGQHTWVRSVHPVGGGRAVEIAARGRAGQDGRLTADLVVVQSPHRLRVEVGSEPADARVTWVTAPLSSGPVLAGLATPTA